MLLHEHGLTELADWKLVTARAVSADGRTLAGTGINPQGHTEGWWVTLGDEESATRASHARKTTPARR